MNSLTLYAVTFLLVVLHHPTAAAALPTTTTPSTQPPLPSTTTSSTPEAHHLPDASPSPVSGQDDNEIDPSLDGYLPSGGDSSEASSHANNHTDSRGLTHRIPQGDGNNTDSEMPRAIVDIRRERLGGEASYIIHLDNQPPPRYEPLKDLPPPTRPVAQWRPDIFMKICCSKPENDSVPEEGSGDSAENTVTSRVSEEDEEEEDNEVTDPPPSQGDDGDDEGSVGVVGEGNTTTVEPEASGDRPGVQVSTLSVLDNTIINTSSSESRPPDTAASNHTPRYEDSSSSPYQDVANFLRDIANSDGFQSAFLGDLIRNFGSLDQNAMKLIYSLLIRPLEENHKEDRMGTVEDDPPGESVTLDDTVVLTRDRLPLRDRPDDGYQPLKTSFLQSRPSEGESFPIRPSLPERLSRPSDEMWRPGRIYDGMSVNRRGEERMDVITAPPTKTFEVVLGSSLSHDGKAQRKGSGNPAAAPPPRPSPQTSHQSLPFSKLTLGLEMPPPEALEALPPGSILIPPSHILGRPNLPKILPPRGGGGTPTLEMPISDFLPNLPFRTKPARPRPSALHPPPNIHDIAPRLPDFLPPLRTTAPNPPPPARPSSPVRQHPPRRDDIKPHFPFSRPPPAGPPPRLNNMSPPVVPTMPAPPPPYNRRLPHYITGGGSGLLSPYLSPPPLPPPPSPPPPPPPSTTPKHKKEHNHSHAHNPVNTHGFGEFGGGRVREVVGDPRMPDYVSDRKENYPTRPDAMMPHDYYDLPPDYLDSYYDLYDEYYLDHDLGREEEHRPYTHEASATFHAADQPRHPTTHTPPMRPTPTPNQPPGREQSGESRPVQPHDSPVQYHSLDDLLGVVKPNFSSTPAVTKQASNVDHHLLQNHKPAASTQPDEDITADTVTFAAINPTPHRPHFPAGNTIPDGDFGVRIDSYEVTDDGQEPEDLTATEDEQREHDASVSHLWNNLQLIPLTPDLFDSPEQTEDDGNMTISLFDAAIPLAPDAALDLAPDLSADVNHISVDHKGVRVSVREEVAEEPEKTDAKFMAYVLIGACCGLALLSITGVIVIVRFKKTCGSRQIKTRTRLTDQDSVENISRHVNQLTSAEESGHKLGSWFTGRNDEHIGSGKLRGNMALPTVHDHKKKGHSSSTRDLLSISSQSSPANSPSQERRESEADSREEEEEEEEPRTSWLHGEYRGGSEDEVSHGQALDPQYRHPQHQHHQSRGSKHASSSRRHSDHHSYRADSRTTDADSPSRLTRERRYTGQSRDGDRSTHNTSRRGSRYMTSMDSEELEVRLASHHQRECPTDSELDDATTHYGGESREPSRYFSDSRELDDVVGNRRGDHSSMTSQELGEHISRDLKQYQSRQDSRAPPHSHPDDLKQSRDSVGLEDLSSQDLDSEESRELRRSHSQVSFSRDNVQNEVLLEFDSMLRQQGQYLTSEPPASTLGRSSLFTSDTRLSISRANTPDSIDDLPQGYSRDSSPPRREYDHGPPPSPPSPPSTPPKFSPPPAPPRPPKPGHLSQSGTPSPQAGRCRPPSPQQSPPSPPRGSQRPVHWTSEEERLI